MPGQTEAGVGVSNCGRDDDVGGGREKCRGKGNDPWMREGLCHRGKQGAQVHMAVFHRCTDRTTPPLSCSNVENIQPHPFHRLPFSSICYKLNKCISQSLESRSGVMPMVSVRIAMGPSLDTRIAGRLSRTPTRAIPHAVWAPRLFPRMGGASHRYVAFYVRFVYRCMGLVCGRNLGIESCSCCMDCR